MCHNLIILKLALCLTVVRVPGGFGCTIAHETPTGDAKD